MPGGSGANLSAPHLRCPATDTDFSCPHGRPWGFRGKAAPVENLYTKMLAICIGCEHKTEHHCRSCRLRRTLKPDHIRQFGAMCPHGKWTVYAAEPDKLVIPELAR